MRCIGKVAWLPGPLHCREEKTRTGNKVGHRVKTIGMRRLRACAHLETCVACQIIASWPVLISWQHKTSTKNMKYIITCVFKLFFNIFWDGYELKEDEK